MLSARRRILGLAFGLTLALGAGVPVADAARAGQFTGSPGWRLVKTFSDCHEGYASSVAVTGPRNAWVTGVGICLASTVLIAHWDGRSWHELQPPAGFDQAGGNAVATLSGSYSWIFTARTVNTMDEDVALLRQHGRWRLFRLANRSVINSAVAFSRSDAWAFGSIGPSAYALRFNGRAWRRMPIPVNPIAAAEPAPQNIWAAGPLASAAHLPSLRQPFALAHRTTRWRTIRFPAPPPGYGYRGASVVADGSDGAFVATGLRAQGPPFTDVPELLHWTGRSWKHVALPSQVQELGPLAHDGRGGLWIVSDAGILHRSTAGTWSTATVPADVGLTAIRLIQGTTSLWAPGSIGSGDGGDSFPVLLKYGP